MFESFFEGLPFWLNLGLFALGAFAITRGADWFTDGAVGIAYATGVPKVIVGATVVSLATTMPEFSVSAIASLLGRPATSVGNAVGSTICNIGLILAVATLIAPVKIDRKAVRLDGLTMLVLGVLLVGISWDGQITRGEGFLLLACMVGFLLMSLKRGMSHPEVAPEGAAQLGWLPILRLFLFGAVLVVGGSVLLVQNAARIARILGVPELVIGLTLVAVGTSLPELITAIASSFRGHGEIAIGNVMGANILNIAWVLGGASAIAPLNIERQTFVLDFPIMLAMMVLFLIGTGRGGVLGRGVGLMFLIGYLGYLLLMFANFA